MVWSRIAPQANWQLIASKKMVFQGPSPKKELSYISLEAFRENLSRPKDRKILLEEYENCLKRAVMSEGHELILWYCEETNQFKKYKSEPWFQFARIIRNVVSHKQGGILRNWPNDLSKKSINNAVWRSRSIDSTMIGSHILFSHQEVIQLFKDQLDFVSKELT